MKTEGGDEGDGGEETETGEKPSMSPPVYGGVRDCINTLESQEVDEGVVEGWGVDEEGSIDVDGVAIETARRTSAPAMMQSADTDTDMDSPVLTTEKRRERPQSARLVQLAPPSPLPKKPLPGLPTFDVTFTAGVPMGLGLSLSNDGGQSPGVRVSSIVAGQQAAQSMVALQDWVVAVNGVDMSRATKEAVVGAMRGAGGTGGAIVVRFRRGSGGGGGSGGGRGGTMLPTSGAVSTVETVETVEKTEDKQHGANQEQKLEQEQEKEKGQEKEQKHPQETKGRAEDDRQRTPEEGVIKVRPAMKLNKWLWKARQKNLATAFTMVRHDVQPLAAFICTHKMGKLWQHGEVLVVYRDEGDATCFDIFDRVGQLKTSAMKVRADRVREGDVKERKKGEQKRFVWLV